MNSATILLSQLSGSVVSAVAAIVGLLVWAWWVLTFNALVRSRNRLMEALGVLDRQIVDAYNQAVDVMSASTNQALIAERDLQTTIAKYRAEILKHRTELPYAPTGVDADEEALIVQFQRAAGGVRYIAESYPLFQGTAASVNAQSLLAGALRDVKEAWRLMLAANRDLADMCKSLPSNIVADVHGFQALSTPEGYGDLGPMMGYGSRQIGPASEIRSGNQ